MTKQTLTLIRDTHQRICWLGKEDENGSPSQEWLDMQEIPFHADAVFCRAYPLTGGSVIVDRNRVATIGEWSYTTPVGEP